MLSANLVALKISHTYIDECLTNPQNLKTHLSASSLASHRELSPVTALTLIRKRHHSLSSCWATSICVFVIGLIPASTHETHFGAVVTNTLVHCPFYELDSCGPANVNRSCSTIRFSSYDGWNSSLTLHVVRRVREFSF